MTAAVSSATQAQITASDFFQFLGPEDPSYPMFQTRSGIRVYTRGFNIGRSHYIDDWTNKKGKKKKAYTPKYLKAQGRADLVPAFQAFARKMQDAPGVAPRDGFISKEIDRNFDIIKNKYLACGGGWAQVARNFNPSSLEIYMKATPFWIGSPINAWVGGATYPHGTKIDVVNIMAPSILTDPKKASLAYFNDFVNWEIGNAFSDRAEDAKVKKDKSEIGSASPCGK